jgi:hypothetical protein
VTTRRQYSYLRNLGIAMSHLLTALIGARYDMSFSAQCGAWSVSIKPFSRFRAAIFVPLINRIFNDPHHCRNAWALHSDRP